VDSPSPHAAIHLLIAGGYMEEVELGVGVPERSMVVKPILKYHLLPEEAVLGNAMIQVLLHPVDSMRFWD
jgi:hypothetical protein